MALAQAPLRNDLVDIDDAYRRYLTKKMRKQDVTTLDRAAREIAAARAAIGKLTPPPDARALHGQLLRLVDQELAVARHLTSIVRYLPQLGRLTAPLAPASTALRKDLRGAKTWQAQRAAFRRYCGTLHTVSSAVGALTAPPELRPSLVGQRDALRRSLAACGTVDAALAKKNVKALSAGLDRLLQASSGQSAHRAALAERDAIRAYDARLVRIQKLSIALEKERQRLQDLLG